MRIWIRIKFLTDWLKQLRKPHEAQRQGQLQILPWRWHIFQGAATDTSQGPDVPASASQPPISVSSLIWWMSNPNWPKTTTIRASTQIIWAWPGGPTSLKHRFQRQGRKPDKDIFIGSSPSTSVTSPHGSSTTYGSSSERGLQGRQRRLETCPRKPDLVTVSKQMKGYSGENSGRVF